MIWLTGHSLIGEVNHRNWMLEIGSKRMSNVAIILWLTWIIMIQIWKFNYMVYVLFRSAIWVLDTSISVREKIQRTNYNPFQISLVQWFIFVIEQFHCQIIAPLQHLLEDFLQLHWRQSLYTEMSIKSWHKNHLSFNWNCIYSDSLISFGKNTCTYTTSWNGAKNDRYERAKLMPCRFSISVSEALANTLFFVLAQHWAIRRNMK